jgi:hypothetical protein
MLHNVSNTHGSGHNGQFYGEAMLLSIVCTWIIGLLSYIYSIALLHADKRETWTPIGIFNESKPAILYERTYESGKKAWRYMHNNRYVYPRRAEVEMRLVKR